MRGTEDETFGSLFREQRDASGGVVWCQVLRRRYGREEAELERRTNKKISFVFLKEEFGTD